MPDKSSEEARSCISQELVELEKRSLKLKTEWNTYAPISQIPDEILVEVFEAARKVLEFSAWYRFLGLCSRFWNVAIAAPTLWTKPPTNKHGLTLLMLERSKNAPLDAVIRDYTSVETVVLLSNYIERIRVLNITQKMTTQVRMSDYLLNSRQKFPRLEELSITSTQWAHHTSLMALPSTPFCQSYCLRIINLANVSLDWDMFPLPNLLALSLSYTRWTDKVQISAHQLLQTLGQMRHLRSIRLDSVPITLTDVPKASIVVDLSHLVRLEIWDVDPSLAEYLLSHISLPLLEDISVDCCYPVDDMDSDCGRIIQIIFSVITQGRFGPLERLNLDGNDFEIKTPAKNSSGITGKVEFYNQNPDAFYNGSTIWQGLTDADPVRHVLGRLTYLNLQSALEFTILDLLALWDVTLLAETIKIFDKVFPLFTMAFAARQPPNMLLPKLRRIILYNYSHDPSEATITRFCDALILRRDCGVPVHTISFEAGTINEGGLVRLREIVETVEIL